MPPAIANKLRGAASVTVMQATDLTKHKVWRQPDQRCESQTQKTLSTLPNCGRLER